MSNFNERIAKLPPEKRALLERNLLKKGNSSTLNSRGICRRGTTGPCALSFAQERLWFLDQLEPGSAKYNIPLAVRLSGNLHVAALEQSLSEILRRHEVLRATFVPEQDRPVQRISPPTAFSLPQVNLSTMPQEQREAKARELAGGEASEPFDLTTGPLLRAALLHLAPGEHVLLVTMHHIISDGWSMGIFYRELSVLYEAFSKGKTSPLPDLPIQYGDFAVWQKGWLRGEVLEKQLMFWKGQLNDVSTLELPTDRPRPSIQTFCGAAHTVEFTGSLTDALRELSRKEGATLFMTLLAAFQGLVHRYTGQEDIVVGAPIANRNRTEIEGLIGFFVNTLVMRTDVSGDPVFRDLLIRVKKTALGAYAHQDLPFDKLVEELQPERDLSRNPLFQVLFALQNASGSNLELSGLTVSRMAPDDTRTRFDLEVQLWEEAERLRVAFVYNTDLFDAVTIERMGGHYQRILEGIVADPDKRLSELPLLTDEERHQILVEWNDNTTDYPRDRCIHELFEEQVERTPDAIAVVFEEQQLTYRELNSRANQLANYLKKKGVWTTALVGICVEQSLEMVIGVLGILKAGGAYVPLDPSYPKERLAFMLEDTKAPVILSQQHLVNMLPKLTGQVICLDSDSVKIARESDENPVSGAAAESLAYVIYTSGSTGKPKGVCVSHRAVNRLVINTDYIRLGPSDRIGQASNSSFDATTFEIWGALLHGACVAGIPKGIVLSPEDFAAMLSYQKISILFITTALFNQMARQVPTAFRSLRCLLFGGEKADTSCVRMVLEAGPPRQLLHVYGPTESTTFASWYLVEHVYEDARTVPIGKPVANTTIFLLDRALQPVPVGLPGELFIGGDGLAQGYLDRPELTAGKFIPDPFSKEGGRLYRTGDLARYLPDGNIEFLGRADSQVKIRGFRIEPGEIEAALGQHHDVMEAIVIFREHQSGDKSLAAYVVPKKGKSIERNDLRKFLKGKLPDYMVPSAFVILDSLPLTPNGKVDRSALRAPDLSTPETRQTYVAPRNKLESQLTEIWEKILGAHPIGVTDNFFDLGGHSLLAVQLVYEIRKIASKDFPVMALFHNQTIERLANIIADNKWAVQWSSAVPINTNGSKKPLFSVHDTNMARYLEPDQPLYILTRPTKDDNLAHYPTLEIIAANNIKEIRAIQPKGPYIIGGFCLWAIVALEMAYQLTIQGEEVSLLFLVDPTGMIFEKQPLKNTEIMTEVSQHNGNTIPQKDQRNNFSLLRKTIYKSRRIVRSFMGMIKVSICEMCLYLERPLPDGLRSFYFPNYYATKIMKNYKPKIYSGKAVLFFDDKRLPGTDDQWTNLITGGVETYEVAGAEHLKILREPYVGIWAKQLNAYLKKVQAAKAGGKA